MAEGFLKNRDDGFYEYAMHFKKDHQPKNWTIHMLALLNNLLHSYERNQQSHFCETEESIKGLQKANERILYGIKVLVECCPTEVLNQAITARFGRYAADKTVKEMVVSALKTNPNEVLSII